MDRFTNSESRTVEKKLPDIRPNLSALEFLEDWKKQYGDFKNPMYPDHSFYYQSPKTSANADFSSKGWKVHVQFQKGLEKVFASTLNWYGQYFKIEGAMGTYFNGKTDSGATIYVGSYKNLQQLLNLIAEKCSAITSSHNYVTTVFGKQVYGGSGSDEPVGKGIGARFDVQKAEYADKYSAYGFATFLEFRGLPVLKKDVFRVRELENIIRKTNSEKTQEEKKEAYLELKNIFEETEREIVRDFGFDFVYGNKME